MKPILNLGWMMKSGLAVMVSCLHLAAQDSGRYQLLTAVLENPQGTPVTKVFKLDTATGRSWVYQLTLGTGQNQAGQWMEIPGSTGETTPGPNPIPHADKQAPAAVNTQSVSETAASPPTPASIPNEVPIRPAAPDVNANQNVLATPGIQPDAKPALRSDNVKSVRPQLDEYNRILQWAALNTSGAWVSDGKGGKVFMPPEDIEKLKVDTEAKKKKLLDGLRFFGRPVPKTDPANP